MEENNKIINEQTEPSSEINIGKNNNSNVKKIKKGKNKKKIIIIVTVLLLIVVILVLTCFYFYKNNSKSVNSEPKQYYSEYRMSGNGLEDFDLKFLQLENKNKNMVYSPLSIKYALAMLKEGTDGDSKEQINSLIGDYKANRYVNSDNMSLANAVFIRDTFKENVKDSYIDNINKKFNAELIYDKFKNSDNINKWVSDKTFKLINDLISDTSDSNLFLINALAIDMQWTNLLQKADGIHSIPGKTYAVSYAHEKYGASVPIIQNENYDAIKFDDEKMKVKATQIGASINNYDIVNDLGEENIKKTIKEEYIKWIEENNYEYNEYNLEPDDFVDKFIKELNSNYKRVDSSTDFQYYVDNNVKVFSKYLKEYNGTTLEYIGIMPKEEKLDTFIKKIKANDISDYINKLQSVDLEHSEKGKVTKIIGAIPLFKYESELKLKDDLKKLGIKDVFTDKANLSKMTNSKEFYIDSAVHKANIEFSNEGIKAAAATSIEGRGGTGGGFEHLYDIPVKIIDLNFNKPYMYLIRDKDSGEVWFVGSVYQPIENSSGHLIEDNWERENYN